MNKAFTNFQWENDPSINTPLSAENLNRVNNAVNEIDNRVIGFDTTKANQTDMLTTIVDVKLNESNGVFTFTRKNGTTIELDTKLEKVVVNFSFDAETQILYLNLQDGTKLPIDLSAFVTNVEFENTATIRWEKVTGGKMKAYVIGGSITADMIEPNYLANVQLYAGQAMSSASSAKTSAEEAEASAVRAEEAADRAAEIAGGDFATNTKVDNIINGTTTVAKATDADTVDGKHASDFMANSLGECTGADLLAWLKSQTVGGYFTVNPSVTTSGCPVNGAWYYGFLGIGKGTNSVILFRSYHEGVGFKDEMYFNSTSSGTWRGWTQNATSADLANYLPLTGGVVNGHVTFNGGVGGVEGGEVLFTKPPSGSNFNNNIAMDVYADDIRLFAEHGGAVKIFNIDFNSMTGSHKALHTGNVGDYALPKSGGTLNGTLALMEFVNVHAASSNPGTYSSFIQNANGTHVRHVTDANNFDEFFIRQGKITYAKMANGAWSETDVLHTGNKPTGSYTGNGSATSRTIATGGMGNACIVYGTSSTIGNVMSLITWGGTISEQGGKVTGIASSEARFIDGGIVLNSTSQFLNESGVTYTYQVL